MNSRDKTPTVTIFIVGLFILTTSCVFGFIGMSFYIYENTSYKRKNPRIIKNRRLSSMPLPPKSPVPKYAYVSYKDNPLRYERRGS
jgi:hypothetical protein